MKKFSPKWRIFLFANFFMISAYLLMFCTFIISQVLIKRNNDDSSSILDLLLGMALFLGVLNSLLNLYSLYRYFPDKTLPSNIRIFLNISWVFSLLLTAGLLYTCILGYTLESDSMQARWGTTIFLYFLSFIFLLSIYMLILQVQISAYLNKNSKLKFSDLINSIGEEKS
jgi:hypothetical protein